jgi:hypothetical protein
VRSRVLATVVIGTNVFLLATIWSHWRFSYFSLDDFNNLFWVQRISGWSMLWHVVDPFSDFFRPLGMSVYWILNLIAR